MDFPSLVAANLAPRRRPETMSVRAEDRYYRGPAGLLRPRLQPSVPATTSAIGLLLLLIGAIRF